LSFPPDDVPVSDANVEVEQLDEMEDGRGMHETANAAAVLRVDNRLRAENCKGLWSIEDGVSITGPILGLPFPLKKALIFSLTSTSREVKES